MVGGPNDLYIMTNRGAKDSLSGWEERLVPLWYYEPVEVLARGERIADIVTGDELKPVLPAIVVSEYGRGRVAYLSSSLESLFLGSNIKELADLIRDLVAWVSPSPQPFEVEGPEVLITNMTYKGNQAVLHLANWTGNKFERRWVNEYYLAPISNVSLQILVPEGRSVLSVKPLVEDDELQAAVKGGHVNVIIPRLDAYQAIAVSYTSGDAARSGF
jgi:hypothetical protein